MTIDAGPFQEITAVSFPGAANPENFIHGEPVLFRPDANCAATGEYDPGTLISRSPATGVQSRLCVCPDLLHSGNQTIFVITVSVPIDDDWPGCVVGQNSGAKLSAAFWPDAPADWGSPVPKAFSNPPCGFCHIPFCQDGSQVGQTFQINSTFATSCTSEVEDCC